MVFVLQIALLLVRGAQKEPSQGATESKEINDEPSSDTTEEAEVVEANVSATHTQESDDQASDLKVKQLINLVASLISIYWSALVFPLQF